MSRILYVSDEVARHNKRNGSVYQSGNILQLQHRRVNPIDPKSANQQFNRSIILYVSRMWKDLTPTEQATWTPCPGETLTGYRLYMSVNIKAMEAGGTFSRTHSCCLTFYFECPYFDQYFE